MFKKFLRYNIVGITGTLIYLLLLFALVQIFSFSPVLSVPIAFFIMLIFNFLLNDCWVFKTKSKGKDPITLVRFLIVSLLGLSLNTGIMFFVVQARWPYYFGVILATFIVPLTNFLLHYFWSFHSANRIKT